MKKLTRPLLLVAGAGDTSDVRYATGFAAIDAALYFEGRRKRYLVVPAMEKSRACAESRGRALVLTPEELVKKSELRSRISEWALAFLQRERVRTVFVSRRCPAGVMDTLVRAHLKVHVLQHDVFPQRARKNQREVQHIALCQRAAAAAMREAVAFLKKCDADSAGRLVDENRRCVTSERVRQVIMTKLMEYGCSGEQAIVAGGEQSALPHERGHGVLKANKPIVLDIFPRSLRTGYWGDLTRTVVRGRATSEIERMYRAVKAAHSAALRVARAGVTASTVHRAAAQTLEAWGYKTSVVGEPEGFIHSTGHGVGLDIHEAPAIGPMGKRLCEGHVVTIEPGLYYRRIGGVRIEDTVLITRSGARKLAKCPYVLEI